MFDLRDFVVELFDDTDDEDDDEDNGDEDEEEDEDDDKEPIELLKLTWFVSSVSFCLTNGLLGEFVIKLFNSWFGVDEFVLNDEDEVDDGELLVLLLAVLVLLVVCINKFEFDNGDDDEVIDWGVDNVFTLAMSCIRSLSEGGGIDGRGCGVWAVPLLPPFPLIGEKRE